MSERIEKCPNPECGKECFMFPYGDGRWSTICQQCGFAGPLVASQEHAIRLHNLICRPALSAEPVALIAAHGLDKPAPTIERIIEAHSFLHPKWPFDGSPGHSPYYQDRNERCYICTLLLALKSAEAHPAVEVGRLRELEAKWRDEAELGGYLGNEARIATKLCADELSALLGDEEVGE